MGRFPQKPSARGSQRWTQWFISHSPEVIDEQLGLGPVDWLSPIQSDDYAEYRDQAFLDRLGIVLSARSLDSFWPRGGPQWDALGRSDNGTAILVESKAHLNELYSPASGASESSLRSIRAALEETRIALGVAAGFDWSKQFYQYANRLAHAYLLQQLNMVPTKLVFLYFTGDTDMRGPNSRSEWEEAIRTVHTVLGLRQRPAFLIDVFVDVRPPISPVIQ